MPSEAAIGAPVESPYAKREVVHLRVGQGLLCRIDQAAQANFRSRNAWVCVTLATALEHGLPPVELTSPDYLDVTADRRSVTLRMPKALLDILDDRAERAGLSRTTVLTAILIRSLS